MRRPDLAAVLALAALVAVPTVATVARGPAVWCAGPSDLLPGALCDADYLRQALAGEAALPVWRTRSFYGHPLVGDLTERVLYPPLYVHAVLPLPLGEHAFLLLHAWLLALGTYALLRGEGCRRPGAVLGGLVLGLSPAWFNYAQAGWENVSSAAAWLPVALWGVRRAARRDDARPAVAAGAALALSALAGMPSFAAWFFVLAPAACLSRAPARLARALAATALAAAVLAGPCLAAAAELNARSARMGVAGGYGPRLSLAPAALLGAFARPSTEHGDFTWLSTGHLGLGVLPLAFAGVARGGRRRRFAVVLVALPVLLAAGDATPVGALAERLPVLGDFGHPMRLLWVAAIGLALLAARGFDALWLRRGRDARLGTAAALGAALAAWSFFRDPRADAGPPVYGAALALPCAAVLATAGALAWVRPRARRPLLAGLLAATALELEWLAERVIVRVPWESLTARSRVDDALAEPFARLAVLTSYVPADAVVPFFPLRVDRVGGADPFVPRDTHRFLRAIEGEGRDARTRAALVGPSPAGSADYRPHFELVQLERPDLLALGATHVASRNPVAGLEPLLVERTRARAQIGWTLDAEVRLARVPGALPRAFVATRARGVRWEEQLAAMLAERPFDGRRLLLVDTAVPPELEGPGGGAIPARIERYLPGEVELRVEVPAPGGWTVLLDAWSPEWTATVDGAPATVARADHLFRAVRTGPGAHVVVMRARLPGSFAGGLVASAVGATGLAAFLRRRRRA